MTPPERPSDADGPREDLPTAFVSEAPVSEAAPSVALPEREPARGEGGLRVWATVAAIAAVTAAGGAFAFDLDRAGSASFWAFAIAPTTVVAVFAAYRVHRDGELADLIRPEWGDATKGILSAALLLGASTAFIHVVAPVGSARESWTARLYLQIGDPRWLRAHSGLVASLVLAAAAAEELVWRGFVTRLIAERVGSRTAWAWAALPYALAQLPTAWALRDPEAGLNPLLIAAALGLGLVWGGLARFTRRLTPSVLSHAAFDWCVITLFRLWGMGT